MELKKLGTHLIIDAKKVASKFEDFAWEDFMDRIAKLANSEVVNRTFHHFEGGGFTGLYLLSESHLSIHTWPEYDAFCFDVFSCAEFDPKRIILEFIDSFPANAIISVNTIVRY